MWLLVQDLRDPLGFISPTLQGGVGLAGLSHFCPGTTRPTAMGAVCRDAGKNRMTKYLPAAVLKCERNENPADFPRQFKYVTGFLNGVLNSPKPRA
jgi:hypothetical protein